MFQTSFKIALKCAYEDPMKVLPPSASHARSTGPLPSSFVALAMGKVHIRYYMNWQWARYLPPTRPDDRDATFDCMHTLRRVRGLPA